MEELFALRIRKIISTTREEGWPFVFVCVYLFFEYVRPQSIYPSIDVIPWVPIIIGCAIIFYFWREKRESHPNILNKLMIGYAVVVILSSFNSQFPSVSFSKLRTFFDWFIIYFLIVKIVNNEERFFIFSLSFLLYSFKMSQHGFITWARRGFSYANWGVVGAPGWFHNSGEVGIQMCIFVPLSIAFIIAFYRYWSKKWLFFFLLMPFTGIGTAIASSSRGAFFGLVCAGLRPLFIRPKSFLIGTAALGIAMLVILKATPPQLLERFHQAGSDRTSVIRLERWRDGLDAMSKHPFLGVGFEAWPEYYPRHYVIQTEGTLLVHNIFVQCGTELGYVGLSVFAMMILGCFLSTYRVRKYSKKEGGRFYYILSYGFDSALIGFLVSGSFVTVLYYPYFWIHSAMTVCLHNTAKKKFSA